MCGIAGLVRLNSDASAPDSRLQAMLGQVQHRGPDGRGTTTHGRCDLAHARLSIIDLLSGHQPMHVPASGDHPGLHLVFNGEIYNHRELRKLLIRRGHTFTSDHSDTEVLLLGYRQWGEQLPKHVHGMFAFAIWDEGNESLFLCRDRIGKKPLYVHRTADRLVFASLIPGILAGLSSTPAIDEEALLTYLRFGYPFSGSMFQGIDEVPPAHWMKIDGRGETRCERHWRPPPISKHSTSLGAVDALDEVVTESVERRLEADVPLGCFLSGGIDSSVVAAIAARTLARRGHGPLHTFCVRMPDATYDETPFAQLVADHIGARLTVLDTPVRDAIEDLRRLMRVSGEPTADSSLLPTHWLCRATAEHAKVAISGDGGDELFGGYDRYRAIRMLQRHRTWLQAIPSGMFSSGNPRQLSSRFRRLLQAAKAGSNPAQQYQAMVQLFDGTRIRELMPGRFDEQLGDLPLAVPDWPEQDDYAHAAMRWDLHHYLPHELLRKVDRASMSVPLEVRCPLLGTGVLDLAGHLPAAVLMPHNRPKGLLREVAARYVPHEIVKRPKRGFAVPMGHWLRTELASSLREHLYEGPLGDFGVCVEYTKSMIDEHDAGKIDHTHRLFSLLQLSLWLDYLKQSPATPERADTAAASG